MSRLTQDGTAEPVSRDQILRRVRGQGNIDFPVQLTTTSRIDNLTRLIHTLLRICHDHKYIPVMTYIHTLTHNARASNMPTSYRNSAGVGKRGAY